MTHTVRTLEQAGASAIQIEDQYAPKRCGHFAGKELIPAEEMVGKVRAADDARREGIVVIARTEPARLRVSRRRSSALSATSKPAPI